MDNTNNNARRQQQNIHNQLLPRKRRKNTIQRQIRTTQKLPLQRLLHRKGGRIMEDYRPICSLCNKPLNKKNRENAKIKQCPNQCINCEKLLTKLINEAKQ